MRAPVNASRLGTRAEKTAATRRRMVTAAYELFTEHGYDAVKMTDIAARASVAVQTLYFTFGTKQQLLHEAFVAAVTGPSGLPPETQPWFTALQNAASPHDAFAAIVEGAVPIFERLQPLVAATRATATTDAAPVWQRQQQMRREAYRALLGILTQRFPLRHGLDPENALDTLMVIVSPDLFHQHISDNGWTPHQYREWATDSLHRLLTAK